MDEKVIVEGKSKKNKYVKIFLLVGIALIIVACAYCVYYLLSSNKYDTTEVVYELLAGGTDFEIFSYGLYIGAILAFFSAIYMLILFMGKCEITVTDKKVTGKARGRKRVDLPLNQISAIAQGSRSSIAIATSSGRICFRRLENRDAIFNEISNLIKNIQTQKASEIPVQKISDADELKKFKDLLDSGVITQEEFDVKKKQLLGL